jgi:histidinol-phosphate aminotransferase
MDDWAHIEASVRHNDQWLPWLTGEIEALGLSVTPSVANFILVHFPSAPGRDAAACDAFLKARGIIVRRVVGYGLPGALRLTIGTDAENREVVDALKAFVGARA